MYKKILLILIVLLIIGCRGRPSGVEPELIEYHKGTEGLIMEFLQNAPPDEIWKDSEFATAIELKNKGAYPIKNGEIIISGFVPKHISIDPLVKSFTLQGRSSGYPEGDYSVINFRAQNLGIPKSAKEYLDSIVARAEYDYQTDATVNVCINPFIYSYVKTKETVCEVKDILISDGQGAPIAITSIKQRISPPERDMPVEFRITIENVGPGRVLDKVKLKSAKLSNTALSCFPKELDLEKDENIMLCKITINKEDGAYIAPLSISLSYEYTSKINQNIKITTLLS